jgi:integrase
MTGGSVDRHSTGELTTVTAAEGVLDWLRTTLGTVAPRDPQTRRLGDRRHRLDLLAELCERQTFIIVCSWLASDSVPSEKSKQDYADVVRHWATVARELGGHDRFRFDCITPGVIKTWKLIQLSQGKSGRTINQRLSILNALLRFTELETETHIVSPVSRHSKVKVDHADETTATPALEVSEFKSVVAATTDVREAFAVVLLYTLAGRVSECCRARAENLKEVFGSDGRLLDLKRKGGKGRIWPIPPKLAELADVALAGRTSGPLLAGPHGEALDRHAVARMLARLGAKAGVLDGRTLTPHVMRATKLTHMYDDGVPLEEIQEYADHARIETTLRYIRRRGAGKRREQHAQASVSVYGSLITHFIDDKTKGQIK